MKRWFKSFIAVCFLTSLVFISTASSLPNDTKHISLNFQSIAVRSLLQMIAEVAGYNLVIGEGVNGTMSLHVKDVPWNQALDIVLKTNGLGSRQVGNVLIVAPLAEIANNQIAELQAQQKLIELSPLDSSLIHLKYASAADIAELLKGKKGTLLSERGEVGADARTNTLWVRDIGPNVREIRYFVQDLDVPAKQVLIEARIVSVDLSYERELGSRFGLSNPKNLSGSLEGANQLAQGTTPANVSPLSDRLNFNLPGNTMFDNPGRIALSVLKLGNVYLDLELSALEREQRAEIISTPRIITSNQKEAVIEQGEEVPYLESTSSGAASVTFKKALLSLRITPQITPDNKIILQLRVTQNKVGTNYSNTSNQVVPGINSEEVSSFVTLKDNQTVVLGGIYKRSKDNTIERVPFLGNIPGIGKLFTHQAQTNKRSELLIFITPRILKESGVTSLG